MLLIDQLKQFISTASLSCVDTAQCIPKILRKDYAVALNFRPVGRDPDQLLQEFYGCGASINWDGYCNHEVDKLIELQSTRGRCPASANRSLMEIERKLAEDDARPIIFYAKVRPVGSPM